MRSRSRRFARCSPARRPRRISSRSRSRPSGQLLALSDLGIDAGEGTRRAEQAVDDGSAAEMFERWIAAQGGDLSAGLPKAPVTRELTADRDGFVGEVSALGLGRLALELGAGRRTTDDAIDHAVGIRCFAKRGDPIEAGQTLAVVYGRDEASAGAGPRSDQDAGRDRGRAPASTPDRARDPDVTPAVATLRACPSYRKSRRSGSASSRISSAGRLCTSRSTTYA